MKTAGKNIDINLQAMGKMSEICDVLERSGYQGRDLETYLVRLLFCFFAALISKEPDPQVGS